MLTNVSKKYCKLNNLCAVVGGKPFHFDRRGNWGRVGYLSLIHI